MRLLFVTSAHENHGSAQDIYHYARAAEALGHEVAVYSPPKSGRFRYSLDVESADAAVFVFEVGTYLRRLDRLRFLARIPRHRRVVVDCDGKYNDPIGLVGDVNHRDEEGSRRWREVCESLSDKICQPTLQPLRANVRPFLFHGYSREWEVPLTFNGGKPYGMVYVGNNWFRWRSLRRLLETIEPIRAEVGRIALVGNGWRAPPERRDLGVPDYAYETDARFLEQIGGVELLPPVAFHEVVRWMSQGVFSPVLLRPLFDYLRLVTCRTFETPAAGTIPLFAQDDAHVRDVYGEEALELVLPGEELEEKILDVLRRPERYAEIVRGIREHLRVHHSYESRLRELVEIVKS